jgi:hypothetical protein
LANQVAGGSSDADVQARLVSFAGDFHNQGNHRTGSDVDHTSAYWLAQKVRGVGASPKLARFPLALRQIIASSVFFTRDDGSTFGAAGVPLYDCARYTDANGVQGTFGTFGADCDIVMVEYTNSNEPEEQLLKARQSQRYLAVVAVYCPPETGTAGLPAINAQHYDVPIGLPVIAIHSKNLDELRAAAAAGRILTVRCAMSEAEGEAINVECEIKGTNPELPPVLVVTPRSGWWGCAVERGTSLGAWVELVRVIAKGPRRRRTVLFTANTGHELGHVGSKHFHQTR